MFGVIWEWFKAKIVHTLQQFKQELEEAFKGHSSVHLQNLSVIDVFVVPDYQKFISPCLLQIERLHTVSYTMHQWRFEAVPPTAYFPLGVKTCYRAYSSDRVVEISKRPRQLCQTEIGRLTGLEPVTTYVRWEPNASANPDRPGIEGIYLLHKIPVVTNGEIPPAAFAEGFDEALKRLQAGVNHRYDMSRIDACVRDAWTEWMRYVPREPGYDSAKKYVEDFPHLYASPLLAVFRNSRLCSPNWDLIDPQVSPHSFPWLQWPDCVAFCMPSVVTPFNVQPPLPRHNIMNDHTQLMLERFKEPLEEHYSELNRKTIPVLVSLLRYFIIVSFGTNCAF